MMIYISSSTTGGVYSWLLLVIDGQVYDGGLAFHVLP